MRRLILNLFRIGNVRNIEVQGGQWRSSLLTRVTYIIVITVFWDVTPRSFGDKYRWLLLICCLHLQNRIFCNNIWIFSPGNTNSVMPTILKCQTLSPTPRIFFHTTCLLSNYIQCVTPYVISHMMHIHSYNRHCPILYSFSHTLYILNTM
jgi:hypothetical protein